MAVTKGHGNPDWTRDEIILTLDLYLQMEGQIPGPTDPRVIALSKELQSLPVHSAAFKRESFRNPDGVAFKLQNLRQVATGKGLSNASASDRSVWADYGARPDVVRRLAESIRAQAGREVVTAEEVSALSSEDELPEGRLLTAVHRTRERSPKTRKMLLSDRVSKGKLICECCGEGPKVEDPLLQEAGFEAHHVVPLADTGARVTRLVDLALLCATCHRLVHQVMRLRREWVTIAEVRKVIRPQV